MTPLRWTLLRACTLVISMGTCFNLGVLSIEFRGTGADWTLLILSIVVLICAVIAFISGELARAK
jgi:hypothetical protein